ncbi:hypothetical protein BWO91_19210 [Plantibacter flavus]|uniref:hypothetical protein n=1 Tax=Plantibacter flavus TaxID=150123 RepID=UPI00099D3D18|nr:hypothetical protein [Plantibacter flavus]AQX81799.1 hypothetical protein BWO91_19210 [Plantibacter flavus]
MKSFMIIYLTERESSRIEMEQGMKSKWMIRAVLVLVVSTAVVAGGGGGAVAAPVLNQTSQAGAQNVAAESVKPETLPSISEADVRQAFVELKAAAVPFQEELLGGTVTTTFSLGAGLDLTFVDPPSTRIGGGIDGGGMYVLFNALDQNLIIGGSGFAIGAAICAIPGVGRAACLVVGGLITIAFAVLSNWGVCQNGKEMKIYLNGVTAGCVRV